MFSAEKGCVSSQITQLSNPFSGFLQRSLIRVIQNSEDRLVLIDNSLDPSKIKVEKLKSIVNIIRLPDTPILHEEKNDEKEFWAFVSSYAGRTRYSCCL